MDYGISENNEDAPIPAGRGSTLSLREADAFTRQWIESRLGTPVRGSFDQMRKVMNQLAAAALAETIKTEGDGYSYQERLGEAYGILYDLWSTLTTDELKGWNDYGRALTDEQKEARQSAKLTLWRRRDPLRGYHEGYESAYQTNFDKQMFDDTAARYLARPWMRNSHLDWVFVDACITRELSVFGEDVKRQYMPGRRDIMGIFHHRYLTTKGNLAEMSKPDWQSRFNYLCWYFAFILVIPLGVIYAAFHYGWTTTGLWAAGIYGVLLVIELGMISFNLIARGVRSARGLPKPGTKAQQLYAAMYQVWPLLSGPVVNPALVRAKMSTTAADGACWDSVAYSIIDRVIAHDAAVWVVSLER